MAVTCTAANLMELSKCFQGLSKPQLEAIKAYLLAVEAGVEPDPGDLMEAAKCFTGLSIPQLKAIQTYLLCQIANATPAPPGETDGLIWGPTPETVDQLDGSLDQILLFLNGTVFGTTTYTDLSFGNPVTVSPGSVDFSGSNTMTSLTMRLLETVGASFDLNTCPALTSVSAPLLQSIGTNLDLSACGALTTINFNSLQTVTGAVNFNSATVLTNVTLPALQTCDSVDVSGGAIETLSLPALVSYPPTGIVADASLLTLNLPACTDDGAGQLDLDLALMTGLVTLNLASVVTITANLTLSGSPNLASFTASAWVPTDGTTIDFNGCSLDIPSVELILRRCVLAGVTTCTIDLSGGTNAGTASLSAQGQADVAALGAQVTMNP